MAILARNKALSINSKNSSQEQMKINIGIFQYEMQDESPYEKISRLETYLDENSQLDLVICPELFISGYGSFEKIKEYSENRDGKFANTIASLAKKNQHCNCLRISRNSGR